MVHPAHLLSRRQAAFFLRVLQDFSNTSTGDNNNNNNNNIVIGGIRRIMIISDRGLNEAHRAAQAGNSELGLGRSWHFRDSATFMPVPRSKTCFLADVGAAFLAKVSFRSIKCKFRHSDNLISGCAACTRKPKLGGRAQS